MSDALTDVNRDERRIKLVKKIRKLEKNKKENVDKLIELWKKYIKLRGGYFTISDKKLAEEKLKELEKFNKKLNNIYMDKNTLIKVLDEKEYNAYHIFEIHKRNDDNKVLYKENIKFQKGPVKENGINGIQNEDLIYIILNRLRDLNSGKYQCDENYKAIELLEKAVDILNLRTIKRQKRNVEGTSKI